MDVRFHCTHGFRQASEKSTHDIDRCCDDVKKVLALNPNYGVSIPGHPALRKMRAAVPHCNMGKSGGYRIIYRADFVNQAIHIVMLAVYFKGSKTDLTGAEYYKIQAESTKIISDTLSYDWMDFGG